MYNAGKKRTEPSLPSGRNRSTAIDNRVFRFSAPLPCKSAIIGLPRNHKSLRSGTLETESRAENGHPGHHVRMTKVLWGDREIETPSSS